MYGQFQRENRAHEVVRRRFLQRKETCKFPASGSTAWLEQFTLRVIPKKRYNPRPMFRLHWTAIVLPPLHGLIRYSKDLSQFHICESHIHPLAPQVLAKCPRFCFNPTPLPSIHRCRRNFYPYHPVTNTQQSQRRLLPPPPFRPPCRRRACEARR